MNYMTAMLISAIVIVGYTAAGGFFAASTTDFVQSIIMTVAIVFVLIYATVSAGGVSAVAENAKQLPGYLSFGFVIFRNYGRERAVQPFAHNHNSFVGTRLFRYAAYPSSLYGD